jgi:hypothetical protein
VFAIALLAAAIVVPQTTSPAPFNPVGKWTFSTISDEGAPLKGVLEIAGAPGAYKGQATTSLDRTLPLREVLTSPNGMIALLDLPQSTLVVKLERGADGKFTGSWAEIEQYFPVTAEFSGK